MEKNINQLAESAKTNKKAFIELYNLIYPLLYRYCFMKTGKQHLSEDIVANVFEAILATLNQYDSKLSSFKTWAFSITNHKLIDHWRKYENKNINIDEVEKSTKLSVNESQKIDSDLLLTQLFEFLKQLPKTEAEIIRLKYYSEFSNAEIAMALDMNENSVAAMSSKALKKLAKLIN